MPAETICLACSRPWLGPRCAFCGSRSPWTEVAEDMDRKPLEPTSRDDFRVNRGRPPKWAKALADLTPV